MPKIVLPSEDVRIFPGYRVTFPVTGVFPIQTAVIKNSSVLVNTTSTASIPIHYEGKYTCVSVNKYGTDTREFSVIFNGKHIKTGHIYSCQSLHRISGHVLFAKQIGHSAN